MKILFTLLLLAFNIANAQVVEIDLSATRYIDAQDGWWYQKAEPHSLHMNTVGAGVSIESPLSLSEGATAGLNVLLGWNYQGAMHMQSYAVPDECYNPHTHTVLYKWCNVANFVGKGHDQGFKLALEGFVKAGEYKLGLEAGPYLHMNTWSEHVTNWLPGLNILGDKQTLDVSAKHRWIVGSVVGVYVDRGNWVSRLEVFKDASPFNNQAQGDFPAAQSKVVNLSVGYKFK